MVLKLVDQVTGKEIYKGVAICSDPNRFHKWLEERHERLLKPGTTLVISSINPTDLDFSILDENVYA